MMGEQLREIRQQLGWSQPELAKTLGIHWNTLARWERGELPISHTIALLLKSVYADEMGERAEAEAEDRWDEWEYDATDIANDEAKETMDERLGDLEPELRQAADEAVDSLDDADALDEEDRIEVWNQAYAEAYEEFERKFFDEEWDDLFADEYNKALTWLIDKHHGPPETEEEEQRGVPHKPYYISWCREQAEREAEQEIEEGDDAE